MSTTTVAPPAPSMSPLERLLDPTGAAIAALPERDAARALIVAYRAARNALELEAQRSRERAEQLLEAIEQWAATGAPPERYVGMDEVPEALPECGTCDLDEWPLGVVLSLADGEGLDVLQALEHLRDAVDEAAISTASSVRLNAELERALAAAARRGLA